jgi:hypothetical protein
MAEVHLVFGVAVVTLNLVAGVWGAVAWIRSRPSVWFWYLLRVAQASVVLQVLLGVLLLIAGHEPKEDIHYMYGVLPLVVNMFAEGMRVNAAQQEVGEVEFDTLAAADQRTIALRIVRKEMAIMTLASLLVVVLAVRAAQVSGGLF